MMTVESRSDDVPERSKGRGDAADVGGPAGSNGQSAVTDADASRLSSDVTLTVAVVARRLGVAPATLRTWARRYGLGPSAHVAGSHRRYSREDVERLLVMRRLTLEGVAPVDAARTALAATIPDGDPALADWPSVWPGYGHDDDSDAHQVELVTLVESPDEGTDSALSNGQQSSKVTPQALALAALEANEQRCSRLLEQGIRRRGMLEAWPELIEPAADLVVGQEHLMRPGADPLLLLTSCMLSVVRRTAYLEKRKSETEGVIPPRVLLYRAGCVLRAMRVHAFGAALVEQGADARVLGGLRDEFVTAQAAFEELKPTAAVAFNSDAVRGSGPSDDQQNIRLIERVTKEYPDIPIFLFGTEWPEMKMPNIARVRTFVGGVHEVMAAARR